MQIQFSGIVDDRVAEDLRLVYLHRSPVYPIVYAAVAVVALAMGWWAGGASNPQALFFWFLVALGAIYVGFGTPRVAYNRWAKPIQGMAFSGSVSEDGVRVDRIEDLRPWRSIQAAKLGARAAILYVSKAEGVPLHRQFFDSERSWQQAKELASEKLTGRG